MKGHHRLEVEPGTEHRAAPLGIAGSAARAAPWLLVSGLLAACAPLAPREPLPEPVPPTQEPAPESPTGKKERWKAITG